MKTWIWFLLLPTFPLMGQTSGLSSILHEADIQGSFTLYDYQQDRWIYSDSADACKQSLPASTFKILNTLVAFDRKIVADEFEVWKWDGRERGVPAWNADTDM
ncbi:MAG: penicillin-binding transpeptidase domain-containing protein, partial [Bacteroidota bacterium]